MAHSKYKNNFKMAPISKTFNQKSSMRTHQQSLGSIKIIIICSLNLWIFFVNVTSGWCGRKAVLTGFPDSWVATAYWGVEWHEGQHGTNALMEPIRSSWQRICTMPSFLLPHFSLFPSSKQQQLGRSNEQSLHATPSTTCQCIYNVFIYLSLLYVSLMSTLL